MRCAPFARDERVAAQGAPFDPVAVQEVGGVGGGEGGEEAALEGVDLEGGVDLAEGEGRGGGWSGWGW